MVRRLARRLGAAATAQTALQVLTVVAGLLALRWMSVEHYAQYSLVLAVSATATVVLDLGLSRALVALVGNRVDDRDVIDEYRVAIQYIRNRLIAVGVLPLAILMWLILSGRDWETATCIALIAGTFGTVWFSAVFGTAAPVQLVRQELHQYYRPQIGLSVFRAASVPLLHLRGALTSVTFTAVNMLYVAGTAVAARRSAARILERPFRARRPTPEARREVIAYVRPLAPHALFFAFQSQLALMVVGVVGSDRTVAEVGALGRIGQLFLVVIALNAVLLEPYIARTPEARLWPRYIVIASGSLVAALALAVVAGVWPHPFLLLLGDNYADLDREVVLIVLQAGIFWVASVLQTMNWARKWVYGWASALNIGLIVVLQTITGFAVDLSTTHGALVFSLAGVVGQVVAPVATAAFVYRRDARLRTP